MVPRGALIAGVLGAVFACPVAAQDAPSPVALRQGLTGTWTGALGYRDYQSDRLVELPVETTVHAVGDGVTLIQTSRFDDGPGKAVWITTTSLDDRAANTTTAASYRAGETVEVSTEAMRVSAYLEHGLFWRNRDSQIGADLIHHPCWMEASMDDGSLFG